MTAPVIVSLYGGMGTSITVKTFAIIVMGGVGNVSGTLLAAWLLGLMESVVATYAGLQFRDAVAFTALIAVLTLLPADCSASGSASDGHVVTPRGVNAHGQPFYANPRHGMRIAGFVASSWLCRGPRSSFSDYQLACTDRRA